MTAPTVATPPQDPQAARREAEIRALEAAVAAAVVAALAARVARVTAALTAGFRYAATDPARWLTVRRQAARDLRAIRVNVAPVIARNLTQAAQLGARHAGGTLPANHAPTGDPLVADVLQRVDADVARKLDAAAVHLTDNPVGTPAQLDDALTKVDAAPKEAEAAAGDAVARTVAGGVRAVAEQDGAALVWWAERSACLHCKGMAGSVAEPGGRFFAVRQFADKPLPWVAEGVDGPPLHRSCRCHTAINTEGLADGLKREAQREVAQGTSLHDSLPARLRAVDRLLKGGSRLPKSVQQRAAADRARGRFTDRRRAGAA